MAELSKYALSVLFSGSSSRVYAEHEIKYHTELIKHGLVAPASENNDHYAWTYKTEGIEFVKKLMHALLNLHINIKLQKHNNVHVIESLSELVMLLHNGVSRYDIWNVRFDTTNEDYVRIYSETCECYPELRMVPKRHMTMYVLRDRRVGGKFYLIDPMLFWITDNLSYLELWNNGDITIYDSQNYVTDNIGFLSRGISSFLWTTNNVYEFENDIGSLYDVLNSRVEAFATRIRTISTGTIIA